MLALSGSKNNNRTMLKITIVRKEGVYIKEERSECRNMHRNY